MNTSGNPAPESAHEFYDCATCGSRVPVGGINAEEVLISFAAERKAKEKAEAALANCRLALGGFTGPDANIPDEIARQNDKAVIRAEKAEAENVQLRVALAELLEVADLRGDSTLPKPDDDPLPWTARMQDAWDAARAMLEERKKGAGR